MIYTSSLINHPKLSLPRLSSSEYSWDIVSTPDSSSYLVLINVKKQEVDSYNCLPAITITTDEDFVLSVVSNIASSVYADMVEKFYVDTAFKESQSSE